LRVREKKFDRKVGSRRKKREENGSRNTEYVTWGFAIFLGPLLTAGSRTGGEQRPFFCSKSHKPRIEPNIDLADFPDAHT
jgi:hypothetical protein